MLIYKNGFMVQYIDFNVNWFVDFKIYHIYNQIPAPVPILLPKSPEKSEWNLFI